MATKKDARGKEIGSKSSPNGGTKANNSSSAVAKVKKNDDFVLGESITNVRQFLKEVVIEFKKITWPGRAQVIQETWSVLFLVAIITVMVWGFDRVVSFAVFGPLDHWAKLHGGGVGRGTVAGNSGDSGRG